MLQLYHIYVTVAKNRVKHEENKLRSSGGSLRSVTGGLLRKRAEADGLRFAVSGLF